MANIAGLPDGRQPRTAEAGGNVRRVTKAMRFPWAAKCRGSVNKSSSAERAHERGHKLDQVGLTARTGLFEQTPQMSLDRGFRDAEHGGNFRYAADLDDGRQHAP